MEEFMKNAKTNIREFAYEAFHQMLSRQTFNNPQIDKQLAEYKNTRLLEEHSGRVHNFTEYIDNAVYVTRRFLYDYFMDYFKFYDKENSKSNFINDLKSILLCWLNKRDNVFVKIIDSVGIMLEAFIYCDESTNFNLNVKDIVECFIEIFEQHFASEFFQKGGWDRLNGKAKLWYQDLYKVLKNIRDKKEKEPCCAVMKHLTKSKVMFPLTVKWSCDKCKNPNYKKMERQIIYVRPNYNFFKSLLNRDINKACINAEEGSSNNRKKSACAGIDSINTRKYFIGTRKDSIDTGKEYVSARKEYTGNTSLGTKNISNCAGKFFAASQGSVGDEKESFSVEKEFFSVGKEPVAAGQGSVSAGKDSIADGKESVSTGNESEGNENESLGDRKKYTFAKYEFVDAKVAHIDAESAHTDSEEQSKHTERNSIFSYDVQEIANDSNISKTSETTNSVNDVMYPKSASDSSEVYISESTKEMNQKLLETYLGEVCNMEFTKNTDFYFVAEEYSHSVKNMINDMFSIQTQENLEFPELSIGAKTYKSDIQNLNERCFIFSTNTFMFIGGKNFKCESDIKKEKPRMWSIDTMGNIRYC